MKSSLKIQLNLGDLKAWVEAENPNGSRIFESMKTLFTQIELEYM